MQTDSGIITKGIGGFYYVKTRSGTVVECRARGIFRKMKITPLVGDRVLISISDEDSSKGVIDEISDRKTCLIRPAVSNVSQMIAVCALENPRPGTQILDKLIASAEFIGLKIVICFNKSDLTENKDIAEIYKNAGFETIITSSENGEGIDSLRECLKDEITVFAGNSGVGKSSLLNCIMGEKLFATGEVSERVERGRHTTRHTELVYLPDGGYIIDTPGFSSFDINTVPTKELAGLFREFGDYTDSCRFLDCRHMAEPDCGVLTALSEGKISASRHESYKALMNEIIEANKRF